MKPFVAILIIAAVIFVGWRIFDYYGKVNSGTAEQSAATAKINPDRLPGLPYQLDPRLREAQAAGPVAFKAFIDSLKNYPDVKDPRLAWIELDYVVMITRDNPQEAKRIFAEVKDRTAPTSPVWQRVHDLEKSYQ